MSRLDQHKTELIRLAAVAVALLLSWLKVWKFMAGFDLIALAATIIGGYPMFEEAWEAIKKRRMTMELSMAIAVVATLLIGQFFTGLVITFFVLFAELLEHLTVESGRNVIGKLLESLPRQASVRSNGQEKTVEISGLKLNDVVIIKPGTKIPIDGIVIKGNSSVDQSSITGESLPIEKMPGHKIFAGTINQTGVLEVRVEHIGEDTAFGKIIHIIEEAEKSKAPIQKVADKLAARLVYFAFTGAIATFLFTHSIVSAIAALIVAGACGIAAGTPLALLAGIGRTAREGIIVKGGVYLEQLASIDTVVLDKTGTLTLGVPQVTHTQTFNNMTEKEVLLLAANAEQHSEHPLANAVLKKAKEINLALESYNDIQYFPGQGIVYHANADEILVGNTSLLDKKSVRLDSAVTQYLSKIKDKGETSIIVTKNQEVAGVISVADVLRAEAKQAVLELKKLGTRTILLTGDSMNTARAIGETLQVDEVFGEMLPEQKSGKVRELIRDGKKVAMVGDGINDAPALIEATVGIAMGTGTDVALESADMALMTTDFMKIVEAIKVSRQCLRVIMFNFWGTIIVDVIGVTLAFFGYLTPLFGALIHVGSELAFILNSARLFRR
ncbi:MAG: cation-translocating P-type ATPase [Candidatus Omnitrophica bacterium]|nr:cation-translocating P-type ATPase [Candidatus Omnitrophota bacterium]